MLFSPVLVGSEPSAKSYAADSNVLSTAVVHGFPFARRRAALVRCAALEARSATARAPTSVRPKA